MKKEKKNKKNKFLILLFILLFSFIWGMPYINEYLDTLKKDAGLSPIEREARRLEALENKENEKNTKTNEKKEVLTKLTCTSLPVAKENYDLTTVEVFEYNSKKEVIISSKKETYTFNIVDDVYTKLKTECNDNSLKYIDRKGYEVACSYNDNEVVMENTFDLSTFETIASKATVIEANAKYKENVDSLKTRLESLGYTCQ